MAANSQRKNFYSPLWSSMFCYRQFSWQVRGQSEDLFRVGTLTLKVQSFSISVLCREQSPLILPTLSGPLILLPILPHSQKVKNQVSATVFCKYTQAKQRLASVLVNFLGSSFYLVFVFWVVLPFLPFNWYILEIFKVIFQHF